MSEDTDDFLKRLDEITRAVVGEARAWIWDLRRYTEAMDRAELDILERMWRHV